ncbi:MAG: hypothetical protein SGJ19_28885, partial [Planctomycetia bacterium]|nr:hypothetical protein [Planctomycetia bacterium]
MLSLMPETNQPIRIYADFNNADRLGRVRLSVKGTRDDLVALGIELQSGMSVELYDDDEIETPGRVEWSPVEGWVAV